MKIYEKDKIRLILKDYAGPAGPAGVPGAKGDPGERGPQGVPGADGRDGYTPRKGIDYNDGRDGINGRDGIDGKDAEVTGESVNEAVGIDVRNTLDGHEMRIGALEAGGGGGGAVSSVNGKTGAVVLRASDVGALPDTYTPPAAPVRSVNGKTGAVTLNASDVGAMPSGYIAPVTSVNGQTGAVNLVIPDAVTDAHINSLIDAKLGTVETALASLASRAEAVSA